MHSLYHIQANIALELVKTVRKGPNFLPLSPYFPLKRDFQGLSGSKKPQNGPKTVQKWGLILGLDFGDPSFLYEPVQSFPEAN